MAKRGRHLKNCGKNGIVCPTGKHGIVVLDAAKPNIQLREEE